MESLVLSESDTDEYAVAYTVQPSEATTRRDNADGSEVIQVDARHVKGHLKEAIVLGNAIRPAWRMASDEGKALRGTDLAPFPLGYFNAGIQADIFEKLQTSGRRHGVGLDKVRIRLVNHFWFTGSLITGTGEGHAENPDIEIDLESDASDETALELVREALAASPAVSLLRNPITDNTFALYINSRRQSNIGVSDSEDIAVTDPLLKYRVAPLPANPDAMERVVFKTGITEDGETSLTPLVTKGKRAWSVIGEAQTDASKSALHIDTWLGMSGSTHFSFVAGGSDTHVTPTGLSLVSAAITFCYMTQLLRYIDNMKMDILNVRLVQFLPQARDGSGNVGPIDTHLFLDGNAPPETHVKLLSIAANTCYLHAAVKAALVPNVSIRHNGKSLQV